MGDFFYEIKDLQIKSTPKNGAVKILNKINLNIYKGDMTVLEPNVCFHMIAVMQFGDWGVEASEAIRVTDNGSELFCNFSKELHIKS